MRRILIGVTIAAAYIALAGVSLAQAPSTVSHKPAQAKHRVKQKALILPNVAVLARELQQTSDRQTVSRQLVKSRQVLAFWNSHRWLLAPRKEKCWQVPWQRSCTVARASQRLHAALAAVAERKLTRELPDTNDWVTAVRIAQRVYPGTEGWLLSCSGAEGGHGRWVWYGGRGWSGGHIGNDFLGMDTVGGWLQFRFSTFAPYWRHASADVTRKGFDIPAFSRYGAGRYEAWLSPLAQALTGGYMRFYGKDGHHWSASHSNGC